VWLCQVPQYPHCGLPRPRTFDLLHVVSGDDYLVACLFSQARVIVRLSSVRGESQEFVIPQTPINELIGRCIKAEARWLENRGVSGLKSSIHRDLFHIVYIIYM